MYRKIEKFFLLHQRGLKFFINHGLKFANLHNACRFRQLNWLAKNIKNKADQGVKAKRKYEKFFHKNNDYCFLWKFFKKYKKRKISV